MAWLLVDLHRGGVFWGDCSLANTLFRRDGDRIQAFLVDAETSEVHPALSDGQRAYDLEILVENVGYGLADVALLQGRPEDLDDAVEAAENVRERYEAIWRELHLEPSLPAGDRHAIRGRLRRLNELGFAVDEIEVMPAEGGSKIRLRVTTSNREFHAHELERLTGIRALEGQARLLLNDMREHVAWLRLRSGRTTPEEIGARQVAPRRPRTVAALAPAGHRRSRPDPGLLRRARAQVAPLGARRAGRRASRPRSTPTWPRAPRRPRSRRWPSRSKRPARTLPESPVGYQRSRWTTSSSGFRPPSFGGRVMSSGSAG